MKYYYNVMNLIAESDKFSILMLWLHWCLLQAHEY